MNKNKIVFSGCILSAVLFSVVTADAAVIPSKDYVDRQDSALLETVDSSYAKKDSVESMQTDVASAVSMAQQASSDVSSLTTSVGRLEITVGDDTAGLVKDVATAVSTASAAQTAVAGFQSELDTKVDTSELHGYVKTDSLATVATTGSYNDLEDKPVIPEGVVVDTTLTPDGVNPVQGSVIYQALSEKQDAGDYATNTELDQVSGSIEELSDEIHNAENGLATKVTNAVNTANTAAEAVSGLETAIEGKANANDVYTKSETDEQIITLAVKRPSAECTADSGLCVLSIDKNNNLTWVNVTLPTN